MAHVSAVGSRLAALRLAQLGLFVLVLSILLENLQQLLAVWMHELGERLKQRKDHEVNETDLHAQRQHPQHSFTIQRTYLGRSHMCHKIEYDTIDDLHWKTERQAASLI